MGKSLPETAQAVAIYPVYEFLSRFPQYREKLRFQVFEEKGYDCVECGLRATIVVMWVDNGGGPHIDVFGSQKMITLDHIYPKSLGGPGTIDNLQPMCSPCNGRKGSKIYVGVAQRQSK